VMRTGELLHFKSKLQRLDFSKSLVCNTDSPFPFYPGFSTGILYQVIIY